MNSRFTGLVPRALVVAIQLLLVATCVQAHAGHGLLDHGAKHAMTSPYHVGVLAAIGVGCWVAARFGTRSAMFKRLLRWVGAIALLGAAAFWTFGQ